MDATGQPVPYETEFGMGNGSWPEQRITVPTGEGSFVPQFRRTALAAGAGSEPVRLTLSVVEFMMPAPVAGPTVLERLRNWVLPPQDAIAVAQPLPAGPMLGPFTFDIHIPHQDNGK